ncbi:hypothetical protein BGY98DRAFT_532356 [Russula aff. rugulosa BPL654]|nr:hypothetical protein BGY98DRAFT_532356 [Russula aff. rugulosa BPL654]
MGRRTLVVQTHTRLPTMAKPHSRISISLGLCLVCTMGTPVADMLAHSPPFPLVIDFFRHDITAEDEEGIVLALEQRHRIRRIRLEIPIQNLQKLIESIDEEYPILEYLTMAPLFSDKSPNLKLPVTLRAPHLSHLGLFGFTIPTGSQLLPTAVGLVTLCLAMADPSTYFNPTVLLQWITIMPQLKTLVVLFYFPVANHDVERQVSRIANLGHVTLPNLRHFWFRGVSAYVETFFMNTTENFRFGDGKLQFFDEYVDVEVYPREEADSEDETEMYGYHIRVHCWHLDWQVSSAAQILNSFGQIFSAVEHLTLVHEVHSQSSVEHDDVDRTEWHKLLKPFSNVKTLYIDDGLVKDLSRCLQLEDGEDPLELLPELQELTYSGNGGTDVAFISFIDARRSSGHPVTLVPVPSQSNIYDPTTS